MILWWPHGCWQVAKILTNLQINWKPSRKSVSEPSVMSANMPSYPQACYHPSTKPWNSPLNFLDCNRMKRTAPRSWPSSYWPRNGRTFSRQCQFVPRKPFRIFMFASLQPRINVICQTCRWLHPRINQDLWQGHPSCRSCFWSHNFHLWTFDATREGKGTLCSKIP